jgi:PTS system nitrogen regulatory IIA component
MQLTVKDAAELLNVSEKTVYRWLTERQLPGHRLGGQFRFNRAELLAWATASKVNVSPRIFEEPETSAPVPELGEALQAGGIFYRLGGTDKESALRSVLEYLRLPEAVDRNLLLQMMLAREGLESTGIGDGVAVPHARNPIIEHVAQPMVSLCFLENPVEFGSLDGQPVGALFTIVSPTLKAHLRLLARLMFALRNIAFKEVIMRQGSRDEILAMARRSSGPPAVVGEKGKTEVVA